MAQGSGCIRMMDMTGDAVLAEYSVDDEASLDEARRVFDALIGSGMAAFGREIDAPATEATQLRSFEPLPEILVLKPVRGG